LPRRDAPLYLGIFLISTAALVFEIALTRVFSVIKWHHFAFMVVSIALFGYGASGTYLALFPAIFKRRKEELLFASSGAFSVSAFVAFLIINRLPFDPYMVAWESGQVFYLGLHYLVLGVPFFFAGSCLASAFTTMADRVNKLYFLDLLGAGIGSVAVLGLFSSFGGSGAVVVASLLGALSSLFFSLHLPRKYIAVPLLLVALFAYLVPAADSALPLKISPYKGLTLALNAPDAELLDTRWNAYSRVDVFISPTVRYAPGLSLDYREELPLQLGLSIDADRVTAITSSNDPLSLDFLLSVSSSLPFRLKQGPKVLVLGSGAGFEVLTALQHGASEITAVEKNPIIIDSITKRYRQDAGDFYERRNVQVVISEERSFLRGSGESYDVIMLPISTGIAASSTGIYALSENYIYTVEAFEDYYDHLSEGGIFTTTGYLLTPPREEVRKVSLALAALEGAGAKEPGKQIAAIRSLTTFTLLVKKGEFTEREIRDIKDFAEHKKFDLVYYPGIQEEEANYYNKFEQPYYYDMVRKLVSKKERELLYSEYLFDISPTTDDKPFFFQFFKLSKVGPLYRSVGEKWQPFVEGGYLVPIIFVQASILSVFFLLLPVARFREIKDEVEGAWHLIALFLCLGLGYMLVEISLIQRFILFLGQPVYSVSFVILAMLSSSGVGSLYAARSKRSEEGQLLELLPRIALLALLYTLLLSPLLKLLLGLGLIPRLGLTLALLFPLGFAMGMPFPTGIRLAERLDRILIPWAFAANGCASVLGSILAVILAMLVGFSMVIGIAAVVYLAAFAVIRAGAS